MNQYPSDAFGAQYPMYFRYNPRHLKEMFEGGPNALRATKALLNQIDGSLDQELSRRSAKISADVLSTPEAVAALRTRLEK